MIMLWNKNTSYHIKQYARESEIEEAIQEVKCELFGDGRIYLDIKKRIGDKNKKENIPDGYLVDLTSTKNPRLFIVEAELAKHHPLKHIAVQILEFNLAFEAAPQKVKSVLRQALDSNNDAKRKCQDYAIANGFENADYLLENLIYHSPFGALVIIDKMEDDLGRILAEKLNFSVDIITLKKYQDSKSNILYEFEPFLSEVELPKIKNTNTYISPSDIDTIVVPAQEEGFKDVFLGENRWYAIRINSAIIPSIKYIAAYETSPKSHIAYYGEVDSISPWKDTGKYVVNFQREAQKLKPIKLVKKGKIKAPQSPRYTTFEKLVNAKSIEDVF